MSAETAHRVSSLAHIYFQINRNYRDLTGIDTCRTRWNAPARKDIMAVVDELERHSAFDIDPTRQSSDCLPSEWTVGGKVPPMYFDDWFTFESGASENAIARLTKWLQDALKEGNSFDFTTLGMEEAEDEDVNEVYPCGKCRKAVSTPVVCACAWCRTEYYCTQKCRQADIASHTKSDQHGNVFCPGPSGSQRKGSGKHTEVEAVEKECDRFKEELERGEVDLEALKKILERIEDDDFPMEICEELIQLMWKIWDQVEAGEHSWDPDSVVSKKAVDRLSRRNDLEFMYSDSGSGSDEDMYPVN